MGTPFPECNPVGKLLFVLKWYQNCEMDVKGLSCVILTAIVFLLLLLLLLIGLTERCSLMVWMTMSCCPLFIA